MTSFKKRLNSYEIIKVHAPPCNHSRINVIKIANGKHRKRKKRRIGSRKKRRERTKKRKESAGNQAALKKTAKREKKAESGRAVDKISRSSEMSSFKTREGTIRANRDQFTC